MLRTELIAPVPRLLRRQAEAHADKIAYRDCRRAVNYRELLRRTGNLAGHLQERGVGPGDSVAIFLPNSVEWVESCFATLRAGAVAVPISYEASLPEIAYRLADADCRTIITTDERAETLARALHELPGCRTVILVERGEQHPDGLRFAELADTPATSAPRDPAEMTTPSFIVYTSGTTGRAKGVILSLHSLLWVTAACWAPIVGVSADDVILSPLPLFHSYALSLSVLTVLAVGATEYICERFSTGEVFDALQGVTYTFVPGVPTMFHYLLQAGTDAPAARFPGLRLCVSAGAIMPATLNRAFEDRFGIALLDGYGITETATMVTMNWPHGTRNPGSCGLPVPGLAVRVVDPLSGRDVAAGDEGELIVRGPNLMAGYHNRPEETAAALRDGWYRTGDLARSDANGYLTITGRLKELIIRGGQNIAPAEIEEAASSFETVFDCAAIGVQHDTLGEVPVLFVVARPGCRLDTEELLAHCRQQLSAYKVPVAVHFVAEIPRTGSGKIMRYRLRESLS
jgi:acyl-CoA synthetase (AMP-forming)/AMP-acid ligase II